jgi:nuclear transport factor 2 (NTF2) superfamily protein
LDDPAQRGQRGVRRSIELRCTIAPSIASATTCAIFARADMPDTRESDRSCKVRMTEDAWNSRDPERVAMVYAEGTRWRNRDEFPVGREEVRRFLERKWARELDYLLIKELWACAGNRIAVRFTFEWHDDSGQWYRSYGNENWEFNEQGYR